MEGSRRGRTGVDGACSGQSLTVTYVEVNEQIDQHIRDNRRISTDEITSAVSISNGKNWCKNGLKPNRKHFILTRWNVWIGKQECWQIGGKVTHRWLVCDYFVEACNIIAFVSLFSTLYISIRFYECIPEMCELNTCLHRPQHDSKFPGRNRDLCILSASFNH
jgi:hypothetical protein